MKTHPARVKQHSLDLCSISAQDALAGAVLIMGAVGFDAIRVYTQPGADLASMPARPLLRGE